MAQAVSARREGDIFQARQFWRKACYLLDAESPIVRVGFESGPKGFDDIWVDYAKGRGIQDQAGRPILREHIQCKWHVSPNTYGHADLVDPEFINANARSLLQRAHQAHRAAAGDHNPRFALLTNWRINRDDPLRELVHQRSNTIRVERPFGTATARSAMGTVRKLWSEHLSISEQELMAFAPVLAIAEATDSLEQLRHDLDPLLRIAGLRRVPPSESSFVYDDVVFQWAAQRRLEFDRATFRELCEAEGLLARSPEPGPLIYGVKSFEHATDRLEDRCTAVLNLTAQFLERQSRPESDWTGTVYPELEAFLLEAAKGKERVRLILDAHLTLSFAAGTVLNIKSGRVVETEQRTIGKAVWAPDDQEPDASWPGWSFSAEALSKGQDLIVAVSVTHDIGQKVREYAATLTPNAGTMLQASPAMGPGSRAVVCGRHAFDLAETLVAEIRKHQNHGGGTVHLFIASPGSFAFYLGQRQPGLGRVTLYEFDFEGAHGGSYESALSFPIAG